MLLTRDVTKRQNDRVSERSATSLRTGLTERILEGPDGSPKKVVVNTAESPLTWLHARGHISNRLFLASEYLRRDWEAAGLGARVTMRWDAAPRTQRTHPAADPTMRQLSARERFDGALTLAGSGLADILWRVVCAGEGLTAAEKALGWPTRAGKLVLTLALERVADYYRVPG
ncbi:DUF6456 domain-containing protein [Sphingobium subterraneum]|uniref:DUF6456 domain-containing protein n=1 Tax=Sphingobium subterraneum TaxID=627688 RepID=A0A841IUW8_9SPHN|nr:DUF6456 domain-containing protein [Sphingobium subterraneum]MBB6122719.1 hypothetical protein [Sphingobium subterraneum]